MNERRTGVLLAALGGLAGLLLGAVLWGHLLGEGGAGQPLVLALGQGGAGVVLLALCAALGATVGTAALPFAGEGPALVVRSLAHFALTALEVLLLLRLCFQVKRPDYLAGWLGILALLYLLVWLGRYVGWYWEVADLICPCWPSSVWRPPCWPGGWMGPLWWMCPSFPGCCSPLQCCRRRGSAPASPWGGGRASVPCTPWRGGSSMSRWP